MDELWLALPTLRKATETLKDGWESVKREMWDRLLDAVLGTFTRNLSAIAAACSDRGIEPDFLDFPVSLLTASALLDCLIMLIARQHKYEADRKRWLPTQNNRSVISVRRQAYVCEVMNAVNINDVVLDVLDVVQIHDVSDRHCCRSDAKTCSSEIWSDVEHG